MIDLHAHVFNAAYLPLEGIARARKVPPVAAWLLARILEAIVEDEELRGDDALHKALKRYSAPRASRSEWRARFESGADPIAAVAATVSTELLEAHQADIDEALRELGGAERERAMAPMGLEMPDAAARFEGLAAAELRGKLDEMLRRVAGVMVNGLYVVEWIMLLLRRETAIVDDLLDTFDDAALFIHHTMDLGPHYRPGRCSYPFDYRQLVRVRALTERYEGRIIPFFAYSPYREDAVELAMTWLGRGFAGVKFYPPSGYRPTGNQPEDLPKGAPEPAEIDRRNLVLFEYCAGAEIPIFAHCQPGEFERYPGAGCLSHPDGWSQVLAMDGMKEKLRLCLGHAGGEGWTSAEGEEDGEGTDCGYGGGFVSRAVELCVSNENVYLEFGCMESILEKRDGARNLAARLRKYADLYGDDFGKRIVYGSDWHMLAKTPGVGDYASVFREIFRDDPVLRRYERDFFSGNALRFLNLRGFLERSAGHLSSDAVRHLEKVMRRG